MADKKTPKEQIGVDMPEEEVVELPVAEAPEPEVAEPERPEWLPEQYKTPEALAEAKKAADNKIREQGEQLAAYQQQLAEAQTQMQQPQRDPNDTFQAVADEIEAARENGDVARELQLQDWMVQQRLGQALQGFQAQQQQQSPADGIQPELVAAYANDSMAKRYDDWEQVSPQIAEILQSKPYLLPNEHLTDLPRLQESLDTAYQLVKSEELMNQQQQLREQGLSQADVNRARKLQSQTIQGASARPDEPNQADLDFAAMQNSLHGNSYAAFRGKS